MEKVRLEKVSLLTVGFSKIKSGIRVGNTDEDFLKKGTILQPIYLLWDNGDSVMFDNGDMVVAGYKRVRVNNQQ